MGWGRTLLLGDIGNRLDIEDTEREIERLKQEVAATFDRDLSQDERIHKLIAENAQLKLYFVSLVRLLIRKGHVFKDELEAMVAAVDVEDGRVDGQYKGKVS